VDVRSEGLPEPHSIFTQEVDRLPLSGTISLTLLFFLTVKTWILQGRNFASGFLLLFHTISPAHPRMKLQNLVVPPPTLSSHLHGLGASAEAFTRLPLPLMGRQFSSQCLYAVFSISSHTILSFCPFISFSRLPYGVPGQFPFQRHVRLLHFSLNPAPV